MSNQVNFNQLDIDNDSGSNSDSDGEKSDSELTIVEEYKLWRKNCRYMYEFISETALTWPSLTIQLLPGGYYQNKKKTDDPNSNEYKIRNLLLSTHVNDDADDLNYLKIGSFQIPNSLFGEESKNTKSVNSKLKIKKKFECDSNNEINRARFMPQDERLIACIDGIGGCFVYEFDENFNQLNKLTLDHHTMNGYGLNWNPNVKNELLTCSDDKSIALWNIENLSDSVLKPTKVFNYHTDIVNDVKWNNLNENTFGSVSDDYKFVYQDKRQNTISNEFKSKVIFNSLSFNKFNENLVGFGGEDGNIYLYDLRNLDSSLHIMMGHTKSITNLEFDPIHENILASSSNDRRIILWDLNNIGNEQLQDELEDGVPELLMMHGGHTGIINDFQFSDEIPWFLSSSSDDNIVHLWKVSDKIVNQDNEVVDLIKKMIVYEPLPKLRDGKPLMSYIKQAQITKFDPKNTKQILIDQSNPERLRADDIITIYYKNQKPVTGQLIMIKKSGINSMLLVRNKINGLGVEIHVPLFHPDVLRVDVVKKPSKYRPRNRHYYIRNSRLDIVNEIKTGGK
ncbi:hypothetical protein CANARDRAFT_15595 [[Candida] arabinofermentans NRRL YB-2248]|uniref:Histone-binding protein RBBP4-like N-terminal domain-containing protein n=1 Tax=[Candida] arabinofermentans NRRL YB-2248 TaxID=983967 RepID=A0A1E4T5Q6_9ASCO|nr:hypothetical protein CANARDRAFT_15595 [[Candida] arabinofermentans NRRL YB-2248]